MKRILSLILIVLLLTTIATPALAAKAKPSIIPTTLWAKCDYFESVRFRNMPEKAKLVSIKSSNTKVIKVVKEGSGIYDNYLEPLKAGKAKITVKYKIGSKSNTISATYTVKKYPNPLQSVEVNGTKVNIKANKFFYTVDGYTENSAKVKVKLAKGWKIASTWGYKENPFADGSFEEFTPKNGKSFTIPEEYNAGVFFTLENSKKESFQYGINFYR